MIFGASYRSSAVVPDGTPPTPVANPVTDYVPSARPGGRAPHAWLERSGAEVSTIDLLGKGFVLFTTAKGKAWSDAAHKVGVTAHDTSSADWAAAYGVDDGGAVLVRPDGYVGRRSASMTSDPGKALGEAMAGILGNVTRS